MEKQEILIDNKKVEIITKLDEDLKDDMILNNELEDTIDLEEIINQTIRIEMSDINE